VVGLEAVAVVLPHCPNPDDCGAGAPKSVGATGPEGAGHVLCKPGAEEGHVVVCCGIGLPHHCGAGWLALENVFLLVF
jgi:hypothetical protein